MKDHHRLQKSLLSGEEPIDIDKMDCISLWENHILVHNDEEDKNFIQTIQHSIPSPDISIAYFILSEQCNLACKYCFLGNGQKEKQINTEYPMGKETAQKGLDYFLKQANVQNNPDKNLEIIFYGGEPLVNFLC